MSTWPKQSLREIADGIVTVFNGQGEVGVSNASFILDGDRAFVVDTMTFPEMATNMADEIKRRGARVETVLNTHHHIDHVGGNQVFADAHLVAHPRSVQALQHLGFPVKTYDSLMPQFRGRFAELELAIPQPMYDSVIPPCGGELHVFTPAHTPADITVWFPSSRVLLAGDVCFFGVVPLAVNGLLSGWIEALDALIALQPKVIVPGHGRLGAPEDLVVLRDYFIDLLRLGQLTVQEGMSLQDALALFDPGSLTDWIESERHSINLERAIQEAQGEISSADLSAMPPSIRRKGL